MGQLQYFIAPALAVMGIAFLFNLVLHHFSKSQHRDIAFGVMFGLAIIVGMTNPIVLGDGIIFDTRSLLLGAAVAFVGPVAGLIALAMGVICRIVLGGVGTGAGVTGLALAFGLAYLGTRWLLPRFRNRIVADATAGLLISTSLVSAFLLPLDIAKYVLTTIGPTSVMTNMIGMALLGVIFRWQIAIEDRRLELEHHAQRDPLTNLLNRRGLQAAARQKRMDSKIGQAVLYFDVDNFKGINDQHGHDVGDAVLEVLARRIDTSLRNDAAFARHGGDEFSIFFPNLGQHDVRGIADRICALARDNAIAVDDINVDVSISLGAYWTREHYTVEEMISRADAQLLLAKKAGKARACVGYDPRSALVSVA